MANLTHTGYIGIDIRAFGATPGTSRKGVSVHINIGTWLFGKGTGAVSEVADGVAVGGVHLVQGQKDRLWNSAGKNNLKYGSSSSVAIK